jgi:hypothetical protein
MEIELIPDGINLRYVVTNNKFRFWVTTPDIKVLGLEIGASRHFDPGFEIHFDIGNRNASCKMSIPIDYYPAKPFTIKGKY